MKASGQKVEGIVYDVTYTCQVIDELKKLTNFERIQNQVQYCIRLKQDIDKTPAYKIFLFLL